MEISGGGKLVTGNTAGQTAFAKTIRFAELFDLNEVQRLQDDFSAATGVASIITQVDGKPITRPSNFCRLCKDIIRNTELGYANCCKSDAVLGQFCQEGPKVQPCLSGGLWDAGAGIAIGGKHIANWLIGQVRDEVQTDEKMLEYAREIGADEQAFLAAFKEVPAMSRKKFDNVAKALHSFANQLSSLAWHNFQQEKLLAEQKRVKEALKESNDNLERKVEERTQKLQAANEELTAQHEEMAAKNQEISAMNEQITAMNETLQDVNRELEEEVKIRQKKEEELSLREKQYRATTNLLTSASAEYDDLLISILQDAVMLVKAPIGYLGMVDDSGKNFVIHHTIGDSSILYTNPRPVETGMVGQVIKSGEIFCVEDYRTYPERLNNSQLDRMTTVIMIPLKLGSQVKGALIVNWIDAVHPVREDDLEVLQQFGDLASIALERAQTGRQIGYQKQLLQRLAETTAVLVNELDLDKALQIILNQATSFMGISHGFIQLFEPDGLHAAFSCGMGRYEDQAGTRVSFEDKGIFAAILRTGKIVVIDDYGNWPHRLKSAFFDDISSAVQAPLIVDGKTIGSIGFAVFGEKTGIDSERIAVLEQFATVASIAVKNAMAHQEAKHQAFHDPLTGLPNRAYLSIRMEEEMERVRSGEPGGAVAFIDLDDIKTINDSFGHSCGDGVIKAAAKQLSVTAGPNSFLARVGGDEFVVMICGEENLKNIAALADRLVSSSNREYYVGGRSILLSASVGVTIYPTDGGSAEELLKNAENALYAAKSAGRNCWRFFEPEMLKDAYAKMVMTNDLRHALERGELYLHYQPQIELGSCMVVGFEALIRWHSKEHGNVPPLRFISLAEQCGLIHSIGQWVIVEACRFARNLADIGREDLHVAVNVSPRQLASADFVEQIHRSIQNAGIATGQLEVEITENVLIDSLEDSTRKLNELSALGVRLSLDDFGTGFSSLTYLRNLPVGTLKIDKSFIDRILEDKVQEGFIRSIIDMAHVLNLTVVAEGVETEMQLAKLDQFGCDCVQGHFFSMAVPRKEAIGFLMKQGSLTQTPELL